MHVKVCNFIFCMFSVTQVEENYLAEKYLLSFFEVHLSQQAWKKQALQKKTDFASIQISNV